MYCLSGNCEGASWSAQLGAPPDSWKSFTTTAAQSYQDLLSAVQRVQSEELASDFEEKEPSRVPANLVYKQEQIINKTNSFCVSQLQTITVSDDSVFIDPIQSNNEAAAADTPLNGLPYLFVESIPSNPNHISTTNPLDLMDLQKISFFCFFVFCFFIDCFYFPELEGTQDINTQPENTPE